MTSQFAISKKRLLQPAKRVTAISEHPEEIPVSESHLQLVEERLGRYRESPSFARPAFEVIDRLSRNRK
jgi:hypothetical protein